MRRLRVLPLVLALALVPLAGCLGPALTDDGVAPSSASADAPRVVVAVIDTGMNLFHEEFARPDGPFHPPPDAELVELVFGHAEWEDAVEANRHALDAMEPGVLYAFPGTKIVGAISFFDDKPTDWPVILDHPERYTHGTMTTSRAAGNTVSIGGADDGIDLVIVQGFSAESVRWAAAQDWIDVISISAGISPFSILPVVPNLLDNGGIEAYHEASHAKPFFASSGNGVANAGLLGYPSWTRGSSGVPDAISVGANANDKMSHWHNFDPYVSADGCGNPAALPDSLDENDNWGGGTSSATPFSAGGGAVMLLEARRILGHVGTGPRVDDALVTPDGGWDSLAPADESVVLAKAASVDVALPATGPLADGVLTLREFKDTLYHTALPTPTADESDGDACGVFAGGVVPGGTTPEDESFAVQGYGEINGLSIEHARLVLRGESDPLDRPTADREYARAHAIKSAVVTGD